LSGSIHDKGVLILSGYLYEKYGRDAALQLSASIAFEQSYSGFDGTPLRPPSCTPAFSGFRLPLRQDLAVTGSVVPKREIQAIGGVNEKIEGFNEICKARRFTGSQGV
jgi:predicted ATP-dependent protease